MAITNIVTDIFLIIFPIPLLWRMQLSKTKYVSSDAPNNASTDLHSVYRKIQLAIIFSVGIFVIAVTSARLPLIFDRGNRQATRSIWASIEMGTACLVSNVGFFYALGKDVKNGHSNSGAATRASVSTARRPTSDLSEKSRCSGMSEVSAKGTVEREGSWVGDGSEKPEVVWLEKLEV
jgi:hypothetical protein